MEINVYYVVSIKFCVLRPASAAQRTDGRAGELYTDSQLYNDILENLQISACGAQKLYKIGCQYKVFSIK